jgi:hypothetical protein
MDENRAPDIPAGEVRSGIPAVPPVEDEKDQYRNDKKAEQKNKIGHEE